MANKIAKHVKLCEMIILKLFEEKIDNFPKIKILEKYFRKKMKILEALKNGNFEKMKLFGANII